MPSRIGICHNDPGGCPNALSLAKIRLSASEPFVCPLCGKDLLATGGSTPGLLLALGLISVLLLGSFSLMAYWRSFPEPQSPGMPPSHAAVEKTPSWQPRPSPPLGASANRSSPTQAALPSTPPVTHAGASRPTCADWVQGADCLGTVHFKSNSSSLDQQTFAELNRLIEVLGQGRDKQILLYGYADDEGTEAPNIGLSEQRARAVAETLRRNGIRPVDVRGFGQEHAFTSKRTPEGRRLNRRVEIWLRR